MALYRKYRPATFAEVVGQEHVTDPLSTALDTGRISHAYLFSGPRGCGKTSSARILARSLNCVQGPTSTPCGVCPSCVALAPGGPGNLDVIELDAASHGGVDDTRELRDRAFYAPAESRYRVFIVDEAHMVTTAGFNALLKIVEEPPAHLIFIFATTEPDKVLPTIRSRTHHYPFRLLPPATMRGLLGKICEQEQVPVEEAVYPLVIRAGGGSPRDSLSVLDQLLAGAGAEGVTYPRAVALLGVTDVALIDDAVEALAADDGAALFGTVDSVMEAGHDPRRFAVDLLERFRDLILLRAVPDAADRGLVSGPGDVLDRMRDQAQRIGPATLARYAELLHEGLGEMRGATAPRLLLEVVCARMLLPSVSDAESAALQRLERLERGFAGGAMPVAPAAGATAAGPAPTAERAPSQPAAAPARPPADPSRRRGAEALAAIRESRAGRGGQGQPGGGASPDNPPGHGGSGGAADPARPQGDQSRPEAAAAPPSRSEHGAASAGGESATSHDPSSGRGNPSGRGRVAVSGAANSAQPQGGQRGSEIAAGGGPAETVDSTGGRMPDGDAAAASHGDRNPVMAVGVTAGRAVGAVDPGAADRGGAVASNIPGAIDRSAAADGAAAAEERPHGVSGPAKSGDSATSVGPTGVADGSIPSASKGGPGAAESGAQGASGGGITQASGQPIARGAGFDRADRGAAAVSSSGASSADSGAEGAQRSGAQGDSPVGASGATATGSLGAESTRASESMSSEVDDLDDTVTEAGEDPAEFLDEAEYADGADAVDASLDAADAYADEVESASAAAEFGGEATGADVVAESGPVEADAAQPISSRPVVNEESPSVPSGAVANEPQPEELMRAVEAAWADIRAKVREFGPTLQALLSGASVARVDGSAIVFAHQSPPLAQRLSSQQNLDAVRSAVRAVLGRDHEVRWEAGGPAQRPAAAPKAAGGNRSRGGGQRESGSAGGRDSAAPPRFSRPSQAKGAGKPAGGNQRGARPEPRSFGDDDIPPPDYPDLPDDPGPADFAPADTGATAGGFEAAPRGGYAPDPVPPQVTPDDEEEMLAEAATPVPAGNRRDPDEVALELLRNELGATRLDG
nr:DNA polymerase III subunit gamma and tau [Nocardia arthritidis]